MEKNSFLRLLPRGEGPVSIRACSRVDLDILANWPRYAWPYDVFHFGFANLDAQAKDRLFEERERAVDRITLVADHDQMAVGYVALLEINWADGLSGNMAVRVHPEFCGHGVGSAMLGLVRDAWFAAGMTKLRLDVAASNGRAIRAYEKAGFVRTGKLWRTASDLASVDLSDPKWDFVRDHVRLEPGQEPLLRFYWMEASA